MMTKVGSMSSLTVKEIHSATSKRLWTGMATSSHHLNVGLSVLDTQIATLPKKSGDG
jgi:hypothetical protein